MSEEKKVNFQTFGVTDGVSVCGPDGCSIADHRKQDEKDNKK